MAGPWFTTPWRLVSQSHGAVAWRFRPPFPSGVPFSFATYRHRPNPRVPWFSDALRPLCGPCHTPVLALCPHPTPHPVFIPHGPPATPWRRPTGSSSIREPFRAPCTGRSYPLPCFRALGALSSARSCPGRLATVHMSWHLWPTYALAREHSVTRRLWPIRDATTRTPTRAWRGVVFCVLYACTACCLAVLDVVLYTSYGTLPFRCLSLATHGRGSFFLLFSPYLARAWCCVCDLHPGSCRVGSPCVPPVFGHKNTARVVVFWFVAVA